MRQFDIDAGLVIEVEDDGTWRSVCHEGPLSADEARKRIAQAIGRECERIRDLNALGAFLSDYNRKA